MCVNDIIDSIEMKDIFMKIDRLMSSSQESSCTGQMRQVI